MQETLDTRTTVCRAMGAVCELEPRVAVTVAFWLLGIEAEAVALKVALVAPEATVMEEGNVSRPLLLPSVTLAPPVGAAEFRLTVQVATELGFRPAGLHMSDEIVGTEMIPLVPFVTVNPLPAPSTPAELATAKVVLPAVGASVT